MGLISSSVRPKQEDTNGSSMRHPNEMVQMDILGPFYLSNSSQRNYYIISCLDDCSRKVASRWSKRKRSVDVLNVLRGRDSNP